MKTKKLFYIMISDKSSCIRTIFDPIIRLDNKKKYEMALVCLEMYYSFPNIDPTNNNFRYSPDKGTTWFNIDISEGCYELVNINGYVQGIMKKNGHYDSVNDQHYITIEANKITLRSVLNIGTDYKVDFTTTNSLRTVLGFNSRIYSEGNNESENIVNILSVSNLRVTRNVIGSSYPSGGTENTFFPN